MLCLAVSIRLPRGARESWAHPIGFVLRAPNGNILGLGGVKRTPTKEVPVALAMSLLMALTLTACGGRPESTTAPTTGAPRSTISPTSAFSEPVLAPRRNRAATGLQAIPECAPSGEAVVHLSWMPARDRGRTQKAAVTQFADGFESGRFSVSPRLARSASRFDWTGTSANGSYRWRVLTKHRAWVGSKISSFIGPSCGVEDYG